RLFKTEPLVGWHAIGHLGEVEGLLAEPDPTRHFAHFRAVLPGRGTPFGEQQLVGFAQFGVLGLQGADAVAPAFAKFGPGGVIAVLDSAQLLVVCAIGRRQLAVVSLVRFSPGRPIALLGFVVIVVAARQVELGVFLVLVGQFAEQIGAALDDRVDTRLIV